MKTNIVEVWADETITTNKMYLAAKLRTKLLSGLRNTHLTATQLFCKTINPPITRPTLYNPTREASCSKMEAFSHPTRKIDQTVLIQLFVKERKKILIRIQKSQLLQTTYKSSLITLSPINSAHTMIAQLCIRVPLPAVINLLKQIETLLLVNPSTGHHPWQVTRLKVNLTSLIIRMQKSSKKLMII